MAALCTRNSRTPFSTPLPQSGKQCEEVAFTKTIIREWASQVGDALNGARTTIHPGDQGMRELHRVATGLPPELAADLVVAAAPKFVDYSKYVVRHHKDKPAIFSSNDWAPVSMPSPGNDASNPSPEASNTNADVEATKPSPEPSMPK